MTIAYDVSRKVPFTHKKFLFDKFLSQRQLLVGMILQNIFVDWNNQGLVFVSTLEKSTRYLSRDNLET